MVESVDDDLLNRITDADVRKAIRILVDKQRMLQEALNKLYRARTASDYRDVISEVRRTIEGIVLGTSAGNRIASALEKAFKGLGIAYEIEAGAFDEVVKGLKEVLLGKESFTNAIFSYASSLGIHASETKKLRKLYEPRPYRHDAEFAVLQAMLFLNYLIKILKHKALCIKDLVSLFAFKLKLKVFFSGIFFSSNALTRTAFFTIFLSFLMQKESYYLRQL